MSLNWERLSAKIGTKKGATPQKVQKKKRTNVPHSLSRQLPLREDVVVHVARGERLAYALWNTRPNEKISIPTSARNIAMVKDPRKTAIGKYIAMDCEFVGVGSDDRLALARVSIVNLYGHEILDVFVRPTERVTNWRTWVSGITPRHMADAITFREAQLKVQELVLGRILVGHALKNDLSVLKLSFSRNQVVDTASFSEYRELAKGNAPGLRRLCSSVLGVSIQEGAHSSVEDARAAMALFRLHQYNEATERKSRSH